ncbi:signal peptide peptidase SppA [Pasteurellaceae bacterium Macca]|nr:signal peptide peptidase SppA [Pasteurellaceae bacterium Macca]
MLALFKTIYRIFRCIREFVMSLFFILFVLVCFAITSLIATSETKEKTPFSAFEKGALRLNLDGYLADNRDNLSDVHRLLQSELGRSESLKISTFDVLWALDNAKEDPKITGLVLDLNYFEGGDLPSLQAIGSAILRFKQANKPVIAVGESFSQKQYYLASYADKIYLNKAGFVDLHGLNYSNLYFKDLLDKLEAQPHIFRVGTYKSAVEPFLRNDMSPEARQNAQLWLNQMWGSFRQDIAKNRQIKAENVLPDTPQLLAQYKAVKGDDAQYALKQQLVTHLSTPTEMEEALVAVFGEDDEGDYQHIGWEDYADSLSDRFHVRAKHKIAVINVEGAIVLGESDEGNAGSDTVVSALRQAREDEDVYGVILRINSPGGSAMASEIIRQEVEALQQAGIPVVASMGGMAASGGYWIAATSDKIIASPTTLTGSIGIFGLAVTFEKTAGKLGIHEDGIFTSELAQNSNLKALSKTQSELLQISIENGYERFLELVSKGRNMPKSAVDKIAQGQVWLGEEALKHGLVDKLGGFLMAYRTLADEINAQRKQAGKEEIANFALEWIAEEEDSFFGQFMRGVKRKAQLQLATWFDLPLLNVARKPVEQLSQFNDPKSRYLYCLNCGEIK